MNDMDAPKPDKLPSKPPWYLAARAMMLSVALAIPCFWRPIVSGTDLQSHLYNAWLAQLIHSGSIHGLWIGSQSTNILVDLVLAWLLKCFGASIAERVITAALVLIFFWGAFQFIAAVSGRAVYWLAPWIAILSYGVVFQIGLLNYYLSCGIIFWLFAILWKRRFGFQALWAAPLLIPAYLAHPMPVVWLLGVAAYCWLARRMRTRFQLLLFSGSMAVFLLIRIYIVTRYFTVWVKSQFICWTGADQAWLHGWHYLPVFIGFILFSAVLLWEPENRRRAVAGVLAQIYFLTAAAIIVLPSGLKTSVDGVVWAGLIDIRLSLLAGVLLLAVLSRSTYRRWYVPAGLLTAAIFFASLYIDIGKQSRVEAKMAKLIVTLPAGARVISIADLSDGEKHDDISIKDGKLAYLPKLVLAAANRRLRGTHLLSRVCIGHCFDYMNYEPSCGNFRIHAVEGNTVVVATYDDFNAMQSGTYIVKASDLPLNALIRCGPEHNDIVMVSLAEGELSAKPACPASLSPQ
jgi:hypothetical protein